MGFWLVLPPPTFYLMVYPLGRLPLGLSYLFFCLVSLLGLGGILYRLLKWEGVLWGYCLQPPC